jgi:hypothetical protein
LYLLVVSLFAMKLSKVVAELGCNAELVPLHNDVPHTSADVGCVVVALKEGRLVNLLVSPTPEEGCKSTFGLGVTIKRSRNVAICDCLDCRGAGSPFLGNFFGVAIRTGDTRYKVEA